MKYLTYFIVCFSFHVHALGQVAIENQRADKLYAQFPNPLKIVAEKCSAASLVVTTDNGTPVLMNSSQTTPEPLKSL